MFEGDIFIDLEDMVLDVGDQVSRRGTLAVASVRKIGCNEDEEDGRGFHRVYIVDE